MHVVAVMGLVLAVLSLEDGELASSWGCHACPQGGVVVAREVLVAKHAVLQRGTWPVYLQGIMLGVMNKILQES